MKKILIFLFVTQYLLQFSYADSVGLSNLLSLSNEIVSIEGPVPILDGGTRGITITDVKGKSVSICNDRRLIIIMVPDEIENLEVKVRNRVLDSMNECFYLGAIHPNEKGAVKIPYRGVEEGKLIEKLKLFTKHSPEFEEDFQYLIDWADEPRKKEIEINRETTEQGEEADPILHGNFDNEPHK